MFITPEMVAQARARIAQQRGEVPIELVQDDRRLYVRLHIAYGDHADTQACIARRDALRKAKTRKRENREL